MKRILPFLFSVLLLVGACVEPEEPDGLITDKDSAEDAMTELYNQLKDEELFGVNQMFLPDILSDNSFYYGIDDFYRAFDSNNVEPDNANLTATWNKLYEVINYSNLILEVLGEVTDAEVLAEKANYEAKARFVRSLMYFQLVRLWGDVPLVLAPARTITDAYVAPSSPNQIYIQIISDLEIVANQLGASTDRTNASQGAANAYLAKVHLTKGDYAAAITAADAVINEGTYSLETNYADLFKASETSDEAIFRPFFLLPEKNGIGKIYWDAPDGFHHAAPTDEFLALYEVGDIRQTVTVDSATGGAGAATYVSKYNEPVLGTDNPYGIRFADVLLIKAEAAARTGDYTTATDLVNQIRMRAGLTDVTLDATNFESIILKERQLEFAFEGDRWFDMQRTGIAETYLINKGLDACKVLMPKPQTEVNANLNLEQNSCY